MESSKKWLVIAICFLISVLEGYDLQSIGIAFPKMGALGLDNGQKGIVASATMVGLMAGAMLGGWFADRWGRRIVLAIGVIVFGLASVATATSLGVLSLVVWRVLTGFGIGVVMPNIMAIASDISTAKNKSSTAMLMLCGVPVGAALLAIIEKLFPGLSWQALFVIGGIPTLVIAPLILVYLPETAPTKTNEADVKAMAMPDALFKNGRFLITINLWIASALTLVCLYLLLNWLPTLIGSKGLMRSDGALAALGFNLGSIVGVLALGKIVDKFGFKWPMTCAYLGMVFSFYTLSQIVDAMQLVFVAAFCGAFVVGTQFVIYGLAPSYYPLAAKGTGSGATVAVGRLGAIGGPLLAGFLMQGGMSGDLVVTTMVPFIVLAGVAVFILSFFPMNGEARKL